MQRYFTILFFFYAFNAGAQNAFSLEIIFTGKDAPSLKKVVSYEPTQQDTIGLARELNRVLINLNELSYLSASYSFFRQKGDTVKATVVPGKQYQWVKLSRGNVPEDILSAAGFRETQFTRQLFKPYEYSRKAEKMLQVLEGAGYPFASVRLDSIRIDSQGIAASWNLDPNIHVVFDTLEVIGNAAIKKWFLNKYLGIKSGSPYNENLVKNSDSRLSELPFLKNTRNSNVYFYGNKAMPILYLDNRKANSIDGIIGFAPNTQVNNGNLLITGEANLSLQNLFSSGKNLDINYRSFLGNSQDLKFRFLYPYLLRTNLALEYNLAILKQDTTFLDVRNEFGLQYRFIGTNYVKFFYTIQTTTLITVDTLEIRQTHSLPTSNDIRNDQYGISLRFSRYDYFLNPRKGYSVDITASIGNKKIIRNPTIDAIVFGNSGSIYDSMNLNLVQYRFYGSADYYVPFGNRLAGRLQVMGGYINSPSLFFNELFRIGGIRTLKGFDEQSVFASTYAILNMELRYLLQQNSNFILFWNGAYYENVVRQPYISDKPYGFGAGLNFEAGPGIFSIFYAVGKAFNNSIEFDKAKIHFGFVNYF